MYMSYGIVRSNFTEKYCKEPPIRTNYVDLYAGKKRKSVSTVPHFGIAITYYLIYSLLFNSVQL